mmetsp:Transcript_28004/g.45087  ORF Transcript_28004/g.45087 Transcript_28004/m.45087 type:complete len:388 (-) Transcript_28004:324-1487(-)|eukprot:jgi/Bigna1/85949/estExt_fgenesh1_pg.C_70085
MHLRNIKGDSLDGIRVLQHKLSNIQEQVNQYMDTLKAKSANTPRRLIHMDPHLIDNNSAMSTAKNSSDYQKTSRFSNEENKILSSMEIRIKRLEENQASCSPTYAMKNMFQQFERSHAICIDQQRAIKERQIRIEERLESISKVYGGCRTIELNMKRRGRLLKAELHTEMLETISKELQHGPHMRPLRALSESVANQELDFASVRRSQEIFQRFQTDAKGELGSLREEIESIKGKIGGLQDTSKIISQANQDQFSKLIDMNKILGERLNSSEEGSCARINSTEKNMTSKLKLCFETFEPLRKKIEEIMTTVSETEAKLATLQTEHKDVVLKVDTQIKETIAKFERILEEQGSRNTEKIEVIKADIGGTNDRVSHLLRVIKEKMLSEQ